MVEKSKNVPAAVVILREKGTSNLVFLQGEHEHQNVQEQKPKRPDICKLLGGKIADTSDKRQNQSERQKPVLGLWRELQEELGVKPKIDEPVYAFTFSYKYKSKQTMSISVYTSEIELSDLKSLKPPSGHLVRYDINTLKRKPLKNPCALTPMNNAIVQLYIRNGHSETSYKRRVFPNPDVFQRKWEKRKSVQRSLKTA